MTSHEISREMRWLTRYAETDRAKVFVYTRQDRDAMIVEGRRTKVKNLCWRWNIGRRAWEFAVVS